MARYAIRARRGGTFGVYDLVNKWFVETGLTTRGEAEQAIALREEGDALPKPVKVDSRTCFGISYYDTEEEFVEGLYRLELVLSNRGAGDVRRADRAVGRLHHAGVAVHEQGGRVEVEDAAARDHGRDAQRPGQDRGVRGGAALLGDQDVARVQVGVEHPVRGNLVQRGAQQLLGELPARRVVR